MESTWVEIDIKYDKWTSNIVRDAILRHGYNIIEEAQLFKKSSNRACGSL